MARGEPGKTPNIKGAAAPPRAHAGGTRIHRKAVLDPSAAACLGGDLRRPEDATVGGDGRILDVPPGVRRPSRESQGQILLLFIVARDAAVGGHFGLVVAGVAVKRKVPVLIGAPLPQL